MTTPVPELRLAVTPLAWVRTPVVAFQVATAAHMLVRVVLRWMTR